MRKKRASILIVLLTSITAGCSGIGTLLIASPTPTLTQASDVVFKTPEETITYYFEGVAQNDSRKILQACAINEMAEKFKLDLQTGRLGNMLMPSTSLAPTDYPLFVETNKMQLSSGILDRVKIFAYSLLSSEKVDDGSPITKMDAGRIDSFMKAVDPHRLATLEIKQIVPSNKNVMTNASYLNNAAQLARVYGADESTERMALLLFEQNYYYLGFTLLRYGENWKISSQTSPIAGTNGLGAPQKTTVDEFGRMTNGN